MTSKKKAAGKRGLTKQQAKFVEEYLVDNNATQAAIRAKYSERTAYSQGQRLLKNVEVAAEIERRRKERMENLEIDQNEVVLEAYRLAKADIRLLFTPGGRLRSIHDLPDEIAAAVQSVKVITRLSGEEDADGNKEVEYVHEIKLCDKNGALERMFKHLGLFERDNRQQNDPLAALLEMIDGKTKGLPNAGG